jgi:repressor LexA
MVAFEVLGGKMNYVAIRSHPDTDGLRNADSVPVIDLEGMASVPLLGCIQAGRPVPANGEIEEIFMLPKRLVGEGVLFLLKICGDSMTGAAIRDGDWAVVRQQPAAEDGEIVAAIIDGEATIKRLKRIDGFPWLMPENHDYVPIPGNGAAILGKVVAVVRRC